MVEIRINEPQPVPCDKCGGFEGYQYSDYMSLHYTSIHGADGEYEMGAYSDGCRMKNKARIPYCRNCGSKLKFRLIRGNGEDVS